MKVSEINVINKISINPISFTKYQQVYRTYNTDLEVTETIADSIVRPEQFENNKIVDFNLSISAAKNLKERINWLFFLADKKIIQNKLGQNFEFRISFVTLTLPAVQNIETKNINECLVLLINQMRNKHNLKNYVWRLEFQKNGNAHYHICTDTYISQGSWAYHWNRLINKFGFIDEYEKERKNLTFREYVKKYATGNDTSLLTAKKRFQYGKKTKWRAPKTADCRNAYSTRNVAFYLAKYFSKEDKRISNLKKNIEKTESDINLTPWDREKIIADLKKELNIFKTKENATKKIIESREAPESNLRLWYCSQNLSKIKNISFFEESSEAQELLQLLDQVIIDFSFSDTFFTYNKFDYDKQNNFFKYHFKKILRAHAEALGYYSNSA